MGILLNCSICCMLISIWGVIQLSIMGVMYKLEAVVLIEDVEAHHAKGYNDFIKKTKVNYKTTAINCWIAAAIYLLMLGISMMCLRKAKKDARLAAVLLEDDEASCQPPPPNIIKKGKIKRKSEKKK